MLLTIPILTLASLSYAASFAEKCQSFHLPIPNVQVNVLEFVQNGTNLTFPFTVRRPQMVLPVLTFL